MTQTERRNLYEELANAGAQLEQLQERLQQELGGISIEEDPKMVAAFKLVTRSVREASVTATSLSRLQTASL